MEESEKPVSHLKSKRGRPLTYTPETGLKIVNFIRGGSYIETAAVASGISKDTFYEWLKMSNRTGGLIVNYPNKLDKDGKKIETEEIEFADAIEKAQAEAELFDVGVISKAAKGGVWQASAWRLERKFPDRYGMKQRLEHSGGIANATTDGLEAEEKRRILKELNLLKDDMAAANESVTPE